MPRKLTALPDLYWRMVLILPRRNWKLTQDPDGSVYMHDLEIKEEEGEKSLDERLKEVTPQQIQLAKELVKIHKLKERIEFRRLTEDSIEVLKLTQRLTRLRTEFGDALLEDEWTRR